MKEIVDRFDKSVLPDLPRAQFTGRIVVVISPDEARRAVDFLLTQPILGFDTETKPTFTAHRGMNRVALLQVATHEVCFLFRLNQTDLTDDLLRLLEDTRVTKVGLSWHDDILQLRRRRDFRPGTFIELQTYVRQTGIEDMSLQKLYANLFGETISKAQRLSNWEADALTPAQQQYAAMDAYACILIYEEVNRMLREGTYHLNRRPEPPEPPKAERKEKPAKRPRRPRGKGKRTDKKKKTTDELNNAAQHIS